MRTLLTPLLGICALLTFAQEGTVGGRITDARTHEHLPGVSIAFAGGKSVTSSDSGTYIIALPTGEYLTTFRFIGYAEKQQTVQVNAGELTTLDVALDPATAQLDMVVVSAGKFEQRVGEVTQSLSVLPPELVREKNTTSLKDGIAQVPGVVVIDNDPQIRAGSGYSFGAGSRVMMLVDDLPILSGDIGKPSWSFLPIENLEQVEVIKGASSVLYGSAALSGVINVRTAYPRSTPHTRVSVFSGMYDTPGNPAAKWWDQNSPLMGGASFFHSQQFGHFDLVLGGNVFTDYGYIGPERIPADTLAKYPLKTNPGGNYEDRARFNIATRWRNRKVAGLNYGVNANAMKSRSSTVLAWDDTGAGFYRAEPGTLTRTASTQCYVDPFINYYSHAGTKHTLRGRYYYLDNENDNAQANKSHFFYGEYQVQQKIDLFGDTRITAGVTGQNTNSDSQLYSGDPAGTGKNTATTMAGYLQVDKNLFDRIALSAGARYEDFKVNDYEKAQPVFRAGATWQAFEKTYLRASYGQGFRFPTIGERYLLTSEGSIHIYPNGDLRPETSVNIEGGVKQGFTIAHFQGYVDAVAFRQDFDHYVEFTFGQWVQPTLANFGGLGFKSVNTGGARISGYELELSGRGMFGKVEVAVLLGFTHTLPVSTTPNEAYAYAAYGPPKPTTYASTSYDTTNYTLKYRVTDLFRSDVHIGYKRVFGGFSLRYNSHVRNIDKVFVDFDTPNGPLPTGVGDWMRTHTTGDWIVDARFGVKLTDQFNASLIVNNLTNLVYAIRPLAAEAPRAWQVQVTYEL